jgi:hypothetical protein
LAVIFLIEEKMLLTFYISSGRGEIGYKNKVFLTQSCCEDRDDLSIAYAKSYIKECLVFFYSFTISKKYY